MQHDWPWVLTLEAGPAWAKVGDTQTFYLAPNIEKTYLAGKASNAFAAGEFFAGMQKPLTTEVTGQFGLAFVTTGNAESGGVILDDADPQFINHNYHYKVRHNHVALKGKLVVDKGWWLMPWFSASIGAGFNRAHSFTNIPLIFPALPNNNFNNHSNTTLTYTLGLGVQKALNQHWQTGVGYEFASFGKSELARASGQTLNSGLKLDHLYTNGLMFNLTYVV